MHSTRQLIVTQAVTALFVTALVLSFTLLVAPGRLGAQGPAEAQSTLLPRFINLTPAEAFLQGDAQYVFLSGLDLSGIHMGNGVPPRFITGFTLPPDYAPGTDVTYRIMWANANQLATNCGFVLLASQVEAYRPQTPGVAYFSDAVFGNGFDTVTLAAGPTINAVRQRILTIPGTGASASLEPGDALHIAIARLTSDSDDTCAGSLIIVGLDAAYQGNSTYLPLVMR